MLAQRYFGWKTALAFESCVMGCRVQYIQDAGRLEMGISLGFLRNGRLFIYFTWHQKQVSTWLGIAVTVELFEMPSTLPMLHLTS